ncbi:hypothetical protein [Streptomyces sp. B6B3]|uniref:hypothetical protein n=1 Tax=Streptomyces sp. B6B3 TaxID=3153570 RepID=UPI00325E83ED
MPTPFRGATPYCYANSLAMILGADSPPPSAIEVLTGSPFGVQFVESGLPCFDPLGWDPDLGLDQAIELLGLTCRRTGGGEDGEDGEALRRLRRASARDPVLVGPVDTGLLTHQPWSAGAATGMDHWVVVLNVDDQRVLFHDPDGFPFATLPVADFLAAWRAEQVECAAPFTMRSEFRRVRPVEVETALRAALPLAREWLTGRKADGARGGAAALERLADRVRAGLDDRTRAHLVNFAVRVGVRRLADASVWLDTIGEARAAAAADEQARLLGSVQYDLVAGDTGAAAATLRRMAVTHDRLRSALAPVRPGR